MIESDANIAPNRPFFHRLDATAIKPSDRTSGPFFPALANVLGVEEQTVSWLGRRLREAGLLSKNGRGRCAAKLTSIDAARLLLAVMSMTRVVDCPRAVREYGSAVGVDNPFTLEGAIARLLESDVSSGDCVLISSLGECEVRSSGERQLFLASVTGQNRIIRFVSVTAAALRCISAAFQP